MDCETPACSATSMEVTGDRTGLSYLIIRSTLIRMTASISAIATVLAAGAVALGGAFDGGSGGSTESRPQALVIDAALARDGRDLLDPRLRDAGVELRVPRDAEEARMNVRYFAESGARPRGRGTGCRGGRRGGPRERTAEGRCRVRPRRPRSLAGARLPGDSLGVHVADQRPRPAPRHAHHHQRARRGEPARSMHICGSARLAGDQTGFAAERPGGAAAAVSQGARCRSCRGPADCRPGSRGARRRATCRTGASWARSRPCCGSRDASTPS